MSPLLIVLLVLGGIAVLVASTALVSILQRRDVMVRASEDAIVEVSSAVLRPDQSSQSRVRERLESWAKQREESEELQHKLIQAGFESTSAPAFYFLARCRGTKFSVVVVKEILTNDGEFQLGTRTPGQAHIQLRISRDGLIGDATHIAKRWVQFEMSGQIQ